MVNVVNYTNFNLFLVCIKDKFLSTNLVSMKIFVCKLNLKYDVKIH